VLRPRAAAVQPQLNSHDACTPCCCLVHSGIDKIAYIGASGGGTVIELSVLNDAAAGWLASDTLVLKAVVTVERDDRFQLDTGGSMRG
jgi:hypothetical protein